MSTKNLYKAIINVMKAVKNIDKSMTVGTGNSSYKGVADKDVKYQIGKAMEENGLAMIPIEVNSNLTIERWEETSQYGNSAPQTKNKQQVFTEVTTKYLLIHESGESMEVVGYGHGVDSQDKAAGKATTYALKYALLYTFMVPTGEILDTDTHHSDAIDTPPKKIPQVKLLKHGSKQWEQLTTRVSKGETITKEELKKYFDLKEVEKELETLNIF